MPVFLAVLNMEPDKPELIARNLERVLTARLRDARFFWDADREQPLESTRRRAWHGARSTRSWAATARRPSASEPLAAMDRRRRARRPDADAAARGARPAVQGGPRDRHGARDDRAAGHDGRHLRARGRPAGRGVEGDLPPLPAGRRRSRRAADARPAGRARPSTWAAVSLADKLDTVVGMFAAGERPTGSRDPLRPAAGGAGHRAHADRPAGADRARRRRHARRARRAAHARCRLAGRAEAVQPLWTFLVERVRYVLEQRGFDVRNVRAVTARRAAALRPLQARRKLEVLPEFTESADFRQLAVLFKRVRNIAQEPRPGESAADAAARRSSALAEPAELALLRRDRPAHAGDRGRGRRGHGYRKAFAEAAALRPGRREVLRRRAGDGRRSGGCARRGCA